MNRSPFFSVVIPSRRRNEDLRKCLDLLAEGQQKGFSLNIESKLTTYEVIVSDDGRNGEARLLINDKYPWAHWIQGPKKGPAANRNNGANYAKGNWLVFTDDDCLPSSQWLLMYYNKLNEFPDSIALEGAIHPVGEMEASFTHCPINFDGGCFWSANIALTKELFFRIGGFDENFPYAASEDQEFYYRCKDVVTPIFVRDAVVEHPVRDVNFWEFVSRAKKVTVSWIYFQEKHAEKIEYKRSNHLLECIRSGIHYSLRSLYKRRPLECIANLISSTVEIWYIFTYKRHR